MHALITGLSQGSALAFVRGVKATKLLALRSAEQQAGARPEVLAAIQARIDRELCAECGAVSSIINGHCGDCGSSVASLNATTRIAQDTDRAMGMLVRVMTDKRGEFASKEEGEK
jgi:hypothetical protein